MGIRVSILDTSNRGRIDLGETASSGALPPTAQTGRGPAERAGEAASAAPAESPLVPNDVSAHPQFTIREAESPASSDPILPDSPAVEATNGENAVSPQVRGFHFLVAAQNPRGRELQSRQHQLERRLESVMNRLKYADSLLTQIDIRLERAQLEQNLDRITSEIQRLRLENAFETQPSSPNEIRIPASQGASQTDDNQTPADAETARDVHINLLA